MPANPADSALYRDLFGDDETARLLSDSAVLRAMLLVEGQLALVQGKLGLIPADAAAYIDRASREVVLDPSAMSAETARNGVPIPALLAAFRKEAQAPEMMQYLHWGATSQDIMDTAQALRLRRICDLWDARLAALLARLGEMAAGHAEVSMAGRTYGQSATPTSFGALIAAWGRPLLRHRLRLAGLRDDVAVVSLSGAAGTLAAMGPLGAEVRAGLGRALALRDPGASWHAERDGLAAFAAWMAGLCASLAKMGQDLILLSQSGIAEVTISGAGGSSTMPQKQNPVGPSVLVALSRQATALSSVMQDATVHGLQRDGAAWFTEWLTLPPLCLATGRALSLGLDLAGKITPDADAMARNLAQDGGLIHAEALTFALAQQMPRPEAAAVVASLVAEVRDGQGTLLALAKARWPEVDLSQNLGTAPDEARAFAALVAAQ
jgi:3-carboxy-cis,cis-muconate cycloisomerase